MSSRGTCSLKGQGKIKSYFHIPATAEPEIETKINTETGKPTS